MFRAILYCVFIIIFMLSGCFNKYEEGDHGSSDKKEIEPSPSEEAGYNETMILGFTGIEAENVEKILFEKPREIQYQWETYDVAIISDIIHYMEEVQISRNDKLGGTGAFLTLSLYFKQPVNGVHYLGIVIFAVDVYFLSNGFYSDDGIIPVYEVTGGKTEEEWDAILELCERIQ
ncbi:MAG: hypothetical protein FWG31_09075 [Oscillospiraceae bacterium]|nr:hypothetical protein [Oscillospiraceae bacterium]